MIPPRPATFSLPPTPTRNLKYPLNVVCNAQFSGPCCQRACCRCSEPAEFSSAPAVLGRLRTGVWTGAHRCAQNRRQTICQPSTTPPCIVSVHIGDVGCEVRVVRASAIRPPRSSSTAAAPGDGGGRWRRESLNGRTRRCVFVVGVVCHCRVPACMWLLWMLKTPAGPSAICSPG